MEFFPPKNFSEVVVCLVVIMIFGDYVMKTVDRFRGKAPHPPNEQLGYSQEEVSKRVASLETWRGDLTRKLEKDKQEILLSGSQRGQRIYAKIDEEVKAMRNDMKEMNRDLTDKCEAIPGLVIATLVNAKKLND